MPVDSSGYALVLDCITSNWFHRLFTPVDNTYDFFMKVCLNLPRKHAFVSGDKITVMYRIQ